jgi:TolB-like protein
VTQQSDSLDVSAELIDARDNSHIRGDQYSRKASDILPLQGDIAKEITAACLSSIILSPLRVTFLCGYNRRSRLRCGRA